MPNDTSSKCQFFQLHIDAYLDHELEAARVEELQAHLKQCQVCRQELTYAERLHRAVVSLPVLDCSDQALEPVDRLFAASRMPPSEASRPRLSLAALINAVPVPVRYGIPLAATILLAIGLGRETLLRTAEPGLAGQQAIETTEPEYSPAQIRQALEDLDLALDYLGQISERTEVMIEDRFLIRQLEESMNASFNTHPGNAREADSPDGPI